MVVTQSVTTTRPSMRSTLFAHLWIKGLNIFGALVLIFPKLSVRRKFRSLVQILARMKFCHWAYIVGSRPEPQKGIGGACCGKSPTNS